MPMSDNPFATPPNVESAKPVALKKTPGALTAILIICLVLGILGFLGSCMTGAMLGAQGRLNQLQQGGGARQQAIQQKMEDIQKQQFWPTLLVAAGNFIVAPLLAVGAIGGLNRKNWSHKILSIALILAVANTVFKTVMTVISQMAVMGPMQEMMEGQMGNQQGAEFAEGVMQISMIVGIAFAAIWALMLIGFYAWAWTYLQKEHVKQYYGVST
jgi:ABC-type dipeptide/oligopeptide/nickel transport system permease component